jgi:hypothetical protein
MMFGGALAEEMRVARRPKLSVSDQPIPKKTMAHIEGCARDALKVLGAKLAEADPPAIVEAIDAFAYRWQKGRRPPADAVKDTEEARLIFGSLWGQQLVKQFGWEWVQVNFGDGSFTFAVVSSNRSLVVYPLDFMLGCMQDPGVDVTVALAFNMLVAGSVPKMRRQSYTNVMEGVHRIVPRE